MNKLKDNIKNSRKTTALGLLLVLITVLQLFVPMFLEFKSIEPTADFTKYINWYVVSGTGLTGVALILAPDKVIDVIINLMKKKAE